MHVCPLLVLLAMGAALAAGSADASGPTVPPLAFDGAKLGMSQAEWESLRPPAGVGLTAVPTCAPVRRALPDHALSLGVRSGATGSVACDYAARFGHYVLPHSFRLDSRFRANGLRYLFVGGRLREIDFRTSIDAFNDVTAMLKQSFGAPKTLVRDRLRTADGQRQSVRMTWRLPVGEVTLTDPSPNPVQLSVRFAESSPAGPNG